MRHPALSAVLPCSLLFNNIKGSGEAIGEALKVNSSLTELNMWYTGLDDDGKEALQDAVRSKEGFQLLV